MLKISLKKKLLFILLCVGLSPLIISSGLSYSKTSVQFGKEAQERAKLVALDKKHQIQNYFEERTTALTTLAQNSIVLHALKDLSQKFNLAKDGFPLDPSSSEMHRKELTKYYKDQFGRRYEEINQSGFNIESLIGSLDPLALAAQYDFISANPNALGEKDKMFSAARTTPYSVAHVEYHQSFRKYIQQYGLYDLFLVTPDGRVVYSVFKEADFGTSLANGPWASSSLAESFKASKGLAEGKVYIADFARYAPSYEAPALFASTPVFDHDQYIGSLIVQLALEPINKVVSERDGLGEKGESILLGPDLKLRADTFRNQKTHNVAAMFSGKSKVQFSGGAFDGVQGAKIGFYEGPSYDSVEVLSYSSPMKVENLNWYLVTELAQDEIYAGLSSLQKSLAVIIAISILLVAAVALILGNSITRQLKTISDHLNESSREVSGASQTSAAAATELSEAATEQAASLQETMASVEEISAMVKQNAESSMRAQEAVSTNQSAAEDGSKDVQSMLLAIHEIKDTNEEIMQAMEESNREFSEVVRIISEIGQKTNVINEIVFQTKLLSFNASVEASRAGEHGKGFAVVAEEVGTLAQMSGSAAKEITDLLGGSIQRVEEIVKKTQVRVERLVRVGKEKVDSGQSTGEKCKRSLEQILQNAHMMASMIVEITQASKEQAQGIQEINQAIAQLDESLQQNSMVAQQSSTQAELLSTQAHQLSTAVSNLMRFVEGEKAPGGSSSESNVVNFPQAHTHHKQAV